VRYQAYSYSWGGLKKCGPVIGRWRPGGGGTRRRLSKSAIIKEEELENAKAVLREIGELYDDQYVIVCKDTDRIVFCSWVG